MGTVHDQLNLNNNHMNRNNILPIVLLNTVKELNNQNIYKIVHESLVADLNMGNIICKIYCELRLSLLIVLVEGSIGKCIL